MILPCRAIQYVLMAAPFFILLVISRSDRYCSTLICLAICLTLFSAGLNKYILFHKNRPTSVCCLAADHVAPALRFTDREAISPLLRFIIPKWAGSKVTLPIHLFLIIQPIYGASTVWWTVLLNGAN